MYVGEALSNIMDSLRKIERLLGEILKELEQQNSERK